MRKLGPRTDPLESANSIMRVAMYAVMVIALVEYGFVIHERLQEDQCASINANQGH